MANQNIGILSVILGVDTRQFERKLRRAKNDLESFAMYAKATGERMSRVGRKLSVAVTAPIVAAAAFSMREYMKFNQAMTESLAIMGNVSAVTTKQMEMLALTLSTKGVYSAEELARAYYFLASAGFNVEESMGMLPIVARFAQAGMFTLTHATSLLSDATKALGLYTGEAVVDQENMIRVSDVLVKANTLANASVAQFSEALTNRFAAALRVVNKDVEEGAAVLAAFAEQGRKGEEAGLAASIVLRDLQRAALKNSQAFKNYGITVFDAYGKVRNMADILEDIEVRFKGMSAEARKSTLMLLGFQERSQLNLLNLIGMSSRIREFEAELRNAAGTTQAVADKQMLSLQNRLKAVWHEVQKAAILFAEVLVPAIDKIAKKITQFAEWISSLTTEQKLWIAGIAAIAAAAGPLLVVLGSLVTVLSGVTAALGAIAGAGGLVLVGGTALAAMLPVIVVALAAVSAALILITVHQVAYARAIDQTAEAQALWEQILDTKQQQKQLTDLGNKLGSIEKRMEGLKEDSLTYKRLELERGKVLLSQEGQRILRLQKMRTELAATGKYNGYIEKSIAIATNKYTEQKKAVTALAAELFKLEEIERNRLYVLQLETNLRSSQTGISELLDPEKVNLLGLIDPHAAAVNKILDDTDKLIKQLNEARDAIETIRPGDAADQEFDAAIRAAENLRDTRLYLLEEEKRKELILYTQTENQKKLIALKEEYDKMRALAKNASERARLEKVFVSKRKQMLLDMLKSTISSITVPNIKKSVESVEKGSVEAYRIKRGIDDKTAEAEIANEKNTRAVAKLMKELKEQGVTIKDLKVLDVK